MCWGLSVDKEQILTLLFLPEHLSPYVQYSMDAVKGLRELSKRINGRGAMVERLGGWEEEKSLSYDNDDSILVMEEVAKVEARSILCALKDKSNIYGKYMRIEIFCAYL